jgi:hypothetical protein
MDWGLVCCLLCAACLLGIIAQAGAEDRLQLFYDRIKQADAKYCSDRTKLLPDCKHCIPGTKTGSSGDACTQFIDSSADIRKEIKKLTMERYPNSPVTRPFGLYPCKRLLHCPLMLPLLIKLSPFADLEMPDFMMRQMLFGQMISAKKPKVLKSEHGFIRSRSYLSYFFQNVVDIGAYYNPINLFFNDSYCPQSVIVIEPILDPLSVSVPCPTSTVATTTNTHSHIIFLPITFRYYMTISKSFNLPQPDGVVCIGCDSHYGPNRRMLETAFGKPYTLFLEYPSEYVHNGPFRKMMGTGEGEQMTFIKKFQPDTNATQYTKRVMKVIEYI